MAPTQTYKTHWKIERGQGHKTTSTPTSRALSLRRSNNQRRQSGLKSGSGSKF